MKISAHKNISKYYKLKSYIKSVSQRINKKPTHFYPLFLKHNILKLAKIYFFSYKKKLSILLLKNFFKSKKIDLYLLKIIKTYTKLKKHQIYNESFKYIFNHSPFKINKIHLEEIKLLKIFFKNPTLLLKNKFRNLILKKITIFLNRKSNFLKKNRNNNIKNLKKKKKKKKISKKASPKTLNKKITGFLIKGGKKSKAVNIIEKAFYLVCKDTKIPVRIIFIKIFNKLKTFVELKRVKVRRSSHIIPFPVNSKRRIFLIMKYLKIAIKKNKSRISFKLKFAEEIKKIILKKKYAISYKAKKYNVSKCKEYKSNLHFRW